MKKILALILTGAILSSQMVAMAAGEISKDSVMNEYYQFMYQKDIYIESLDMTVGEAKSELSRLNEQYSITEDDAEKDRIFERMDTVYKAVNEVINFSSIDYEQIASYCELEAQRKEIKEKNIEIKKIFDEFTYYSQKSGVAMLGVESHTLYPDGTDIVEKAIISDDDKKEIISLLDTIIDNSYIEIASKDNLSGFSYDVLFMETSLKRMNENENGGYEEVLAKIAEVNKILYPDEAEEIVSSDIVFTDVNESDWFYEDVIIANGMGLINGVEDTLFVPQGTLTIAEAITLAARTYAYEANELKELKAPSSDSAHWAESYLNYAKKQGITQRNYTFEELDTPITRAEMADLFSKALYSSDNEKINDFKNAPEQNVSESIKKLYELGIIIGDENGLFRSDDNITRAETAAIICRMVLPFKRIKK